MKSILPVGSVVLAFLLSANAVFAQERDGGYPPSTSLEDVLARIKQVPKEHPRLLATRAELAALPNSLDADPLRRELAEAVIHEADLISKVAPITRTLQGRRLLGQSRTCLQRVTMLAMAYHLTNDRRYVERCDREMLAVSRFEDWNPTHFLDVAEMTCALAIGYDWLFDQLPEGSREAIRTAIVQKGVTLPFTTRHKGWVKSRNNWGQVCHGGLTAGALAVLEHEPELAARTVHSALQNVTRSMASFAPSGSYPEGPGYWSYGTSYNVLLIAVLESTFGTDFGLTGAPGFAETGQYVSLACGPSGLFFNYADGGASRSPQPVLFWFAKRFDRPDWLLGEREIWKSNIARVKRQRSPSSGGRLAPFALLWINSTSKDFDIKMPLHWQSGGDTPIAIHRSSWTDPNATYVGLKGGSPSGSHGQMDTGSFVLDADGVRWATDLGAEGYHGIESRGMNLWSSAQDSDRWTIFRQSNFGHNTLVIDGKLQQAKGSGKIVRFSDDASFACSVVDLSSVYEGQAQSVQRGVALLPSGEVLIHDQLTGLKPGSHVCWGMITPGKPADVSKSTIALHAEGAQLKLSNISPQPLNWQLIDTAKPRHEWDSPNRGTVMVALEAVAPDSGKLVFSVLATPGSCENSLLDSLQVSPLETWAR